MHDAAVDVCVCVDSLSSFSSSEVSSYILATLMVASLVQLTSDSIVLSASRVQADIVVQTV